MIKKWFQNIGPGTLVAAAFIGPGTVTLCTIAGVNFGFNLLWAMLLSIIATIVLQEMAARLGVISQKGLSEVIREEIKTPLQLKNPAKEFKVIERKTDDLGQTHIKLQQSYKGLEVYGGQVWLHATKGQVNLFNGRNHATPSVENINPSYSANQAQSIADNNLAAIHLSNAMNPKPLAFRDNKQHIVSTVMDNTSVYCQHKHQQNQVQVDGKYGRRALTRLWH